MIEIYGPPLAPPVEYMRWVLDRMDAPYTLTASAAGFSAIRSRRLKVPIEPPLLVVDGTAHGGFRTCLGVLHQSLNERAPHPQPSPDAELLEMLFKNLFTQAVRCFYRNMLGAPQSLKPMSTRGVPTWQRWSITSVYPAWRWILARGLKLDANKAAVDEAAMQSAFAHVAGRLLDQPFLGGAAPGADDILFAAIASPIILPPGHPVPMPDLAGLPVRYRETVERYRATPAGRLVTRTYAQRAADHDRAATV